jgi:hypothetical protein
LLPAGYSHDRKPLLPRPSTHRDQQPHEDHMFAYTAERRLLGFDMGDWALLLGGFAFVGMVTLLTA